MYLSRGTHILTFRGTPPRKVNLYLDGDLWLTRDLDGKTTTVKFNTLFPGTLTSPNNFDVSSKELEIGKKTEAEAPERNDWKDIKIVRVQGLTHTPARIFRGSNPAIIQVGEMFYSYPAQIRAFILLHELGHFYHHDESAADHWALQKFLELGLNASQAFYALSKVLHPTPNNAERIKKLLETLKKNGYVKD